MVGCGAIGCELLKNLAMIGAGSEGFLELLTRTTLKSLIFQDNFFLEGIMLVI